MLAQLHAICPFGVQEIGTLPGLCKLYNLISFYGRADPPVKALP